MQEHSKQDIGKGRSHTDALFIQKIQSPATTSLLVLVPDPTVLVPTIDLAPFQIIAKLVLILCAYLHSLWLIAIKGSFPAFHFLSERFI